MFKPRTYKSKMFESKMYKSNWKRAAILPLLLFALFAAADSPNPNAQLPAGPMLEKASAACSSCHEARIIVQQRLGKPAWTKEVDKMIKWGAEVDPKDRDALIDYFSANFGPDQPTYIAPRTAAEAALNANQKNSAVKKP